MIGEDGRRVPWTGMVGEDCRALQTAATTKKTETRWTLKEQLYYRIDPSLFSFKVTLGFFLLSLFLLLSTCALALFAMEQRWRSGRRLHYLGGVGYVDVSANRQ